MHVPAHLPLAESVDKERDHEDLQLFEGGKKKSGQRQRSPCCSHTPGDYFFSFVLILYLRVHQRLNTQRALSHRTTAAMEKKRGKKALLFQMLSPSSV